MADKETRLKCYKTFIRPTVEYANTVWDPTDNQSLTQKIEMIQRKSIRWICREWSSEVSPNDLRKSLKLETLETRRSKSKLKMLLIFCQETNSLTAVSTQLDSVVQM
eukprot:TCONS_00025656-protein